MVAGNIGRTLVFALAALLTWTSVATGRETVLPPTGQFQCRDWDNVPTNLLAVLVLNGDGSYEATDRVDDLNANRPTTTGRYTYNEDKRKIDWTSGAWKDRIGTYMPNVKGTDFVVVHTKQDPEGKVQGGALRCARSSPPR